MLKVKEFKDFVTEPNIADINLSEVTFSFNALCNGTSLTDYRDQKAIELQVAYLDTLKDRSITESLLYLHAEHSLEEPMVSESVLSAIREAYNSFQLHITAHPLGQRSAIAREVMEVLASGSVSQALTCPIEGDKNTTLHEIVTALKKLPQINDLFSCQETTHLFRKNYLYSSAEVTPFTRLVGIDSVTTILGKQQGVLWIDADGLLPKSLHPILENSLNASTSHTLQSQNRKGSPSEIRFVLRDSPSEIDNLVKSVEQFSAHNRLHLMKGVVLSQVENVTQVATLYASLGEAINSYSNHGHQNLAKTLAELEITIFLEDSKSIVNGAEIIRCVRDEQATISKTLPEELQASYLKKPMLGFGLSDLSKEIGSAAAFGRAMDCIQEVFSENLVGNQLIIGGSSCIERSGMRLETAQFWSDSIQSIAPNALPVITIQDDQVARLLDIVRIEKTAPPFLTIAKQSNENTLLDRSTILDDLEKHQYQVQSPFVDIITTARELGISGEAYSERPAIRAGANNLSKEEAFTMLRAIGCNHDSYALGFTHTAADIGSYIKSYEDSGKTEAEALRNISDVYPHWKESLALQDDLFHPELFRELATYLLVRSKIASSDDAALNGTRICRMTTLIYEKNLWDDLAGFPSTLISDCLERLQVLDPAIRPFSQKVSFCGPAFPVE